MRPFLADLSRVADTLISTYPNAGLPNEFGEYDETPEQMCGQIEEWAKAGLLNIVGGCCGTTPPHIAHIAKHVAGLPPRSVPQKSVAMRLSGLEPFELASCIRKTSPAASSTSACAPTSPAPPASRR